MALLLTGGAGYIGSHCLKILRNTMQREILVLDDLSNGHPELLQGHPFIHGTTLDADHVAGLLKKHNVQTVMHFAASAYVGESCQNPEKYYLNNVFGTLQLLRAMRQANVHQLVFSSTCAVYGHPGNKPEDYPITENTSKLPINPYGASKLAVERMIEDFSMAYGLRYVIFRYFNAAGADSEAEIGEWHEPETHLIPLALKTALAFAQNKPDAQPLDILGNDYPTPDGSCIRDYIHVNDIVRAHLLGLTYLEQGGESTAFNIGNGYGYSVKSIISACERVSGLKIPTRLKPRRQGDPPILVASAAKLQKTLGWQPEFPHLDDIIATAWRWEQCHKSC